MTNKQKFLNKKQQAQQDNYELTCCDKQNPKDGQLVIEILPNKSYQRKVFTYPVQQKLSVL